MTARRLVCVAHAPSLSPSEAGGKVDAWKLLRASQHGLRAGRGRHTRGGAGLGKHVVC